MTADDLGWPKGAEEPRSGGSGSVVVHGGYAVNVDGSNDDGAANKPCQKSRYENGRNIMRLGK